MSNLTLKKLINLKLYNSKFTRISPLFLSLANKRSYCNAPKELNGEVISNDISRLPKSLNDRIKRKPVVPNPGPYSFKERALKSQQLAFRFSGHASGVDAGNCWPTESKLDEIINDELIYESTLPEMMDILAMDKQAKQLKRSEKEKKVIEQMAKMPKIIEDYRRRLQKTENIEAASLTKRTSEKAEAREYFGFDIDPRDPRYEHMQEVKAEQMKTDKKLRKKEEKQARLLAALSAGSKQSKSK